MARSKPQSKKRTPSGSSAPRNTRPWTAEQIAILVEARARDVPHKTIAARVGRTERACRIRMYHFNQAQRSAVPSSLAAPSATITDAAAILPAAPAVDPSPSLGSAASSSSAAPPATITGSAATPLVAFPTPPYSDDPAIVPMLPGAHHEPSATHQPSPSQDVYDAASTLVMMSHSEDKMEAALALVQMKWGEPVAVRKARIVMTGMCAEKRLLRYNISD